MEENNNKEEEKKPKANNDSLWKMFIRKYLPEFLEEFMPKLHKKVDWSREIDFLESEFDKLFPSESTLGRITNDRLIKLPMIKKKKPTFLFVHIEIQSRFDRWFAQKMWHFFYRIYDLINGHSHKGKKLPITAIAIYTGSKIPKKYRKHGAKSAGTKYFYEFNTYVAKGQAIKKLEASKNIFSILILASIYKMKTENDDEKRLIYKEKLSKLAIEKGIDGEQIIDLLAFIHYVVTLPLKLDQIYINNITETLKKDKKMIDPAPMDFMIDHISKIAHGESVGDRIQQAEAKTQQMETRVQQVEAEKRQMEAEKQQMETEKQQMETEKQQMEFNYMKILLEAGFSIQKIAESMKLSVEYVKNLGQKLK